MPPETFEPARAIAGLKCAYCEAPLRGMTDAIFDPCRKLICRDQVECDKRRRQNQMIAHGAYYVS